MWRCLDLDVVPEATYIETNNNIIFVDFSEKIRSTCLAVRRPDKRHNDDVSLLKFNYTKCPEN